MKLYKYLVLSLVLSKQLLAQSNPVMELQNSLSTAADKYLHKFDPQAQSRVIIKLKQVNTSLPGTELTVSGDIPIDAQVGLKSDDIAKINVNIEGMEAALPEWLTNKIAEITSFGKVKAQVDYAQFPADLIKSIKQLENNSESTKTQSFWTQFANEYFTKMSLLFIVLTLVLGATFYFTKSKSAVVQEEKNKNSTPSPSPSAESFANFKTSHLKSSREYASSNSSENSSFQKIPDHSLLALWSDCYWTENDEYAHFVWNQLSWNQKEFLLKTWAPSFGYMKYVTSLETKDLGLENDPAYLLKMNMENLSTDDLSSEVVKNNSLWKFISQIRRNSLNFNLEMQKKCTEAKPMAVKEFNFKNSLNFRNFNLNNEMLYPSLKEEEALYSNPKKLNPSEKLRLNSLLLVAWMPAEARAQLFSQYSATDLASAWSGPEALLNDISKSLPELKLVLLNSYVKQFKADRNSESFKSLVQNAINYFKNNPQHLEVFNIGGSGESKAA